MSKRPETVRPSRRTFLKGVVAAGGTASVLAAGSAAVAEVEQAPVADNTAKAQAKGYRLTPHIAEYYKKARF